jgi:3D-(3,5/4)-trihydroxycyclohexane-1,2-dione acylhydrolase (decyclizing)
MLMLCGDIFLTRLPDPVLQQLEHYGNPALGSERCVQGGQPLLGPDHPSGADHPVAAAAIATMLDPADCGPAFLGLPQDVQGWTYDYPVALFERNPPHPPPGARRQ